MRLHFLLKERDFYHHCNNFNAFSFHQCALCASILFFIDIYRICECFCNRLHSSILFSQHILNKICWFFFSFVFVIFYSSVICWCVCSSGDVYNAYVNPKKKEFYGKTIDKRITQNRRNENMNDSIILMINFLLFSCCSAYFFWFLSQILLFVVFSQCILCYL